MNIMPAVKSLMVLGVTVLFTFLNSCNDETKPCVPEDVLTPVVVDCSLTQEIESIRGMIIGEWKWLQEQTAIRGQSEQYISPKDAGYTRTLKVGVSTLTFFKCDEQKTFKYSIVRLGEVTGTNHTEDDWPVLVTYDFETGLRELAVPVKICDSFLVLQYQYMSSVTGELTWKREAY